MEPHGGFSSKELFGYQRLRDNLGVKHTTSGIKTICLGSQKPSCACYFAVVTRGTHPVRVPRLWIHQAVGERLVVVNPRWQSESTDGPKGGWSCVSWSGCNGCNGHLTQLLDVVWCSAAVAVV